MREENQKAVRSRPSNPTGFTLIELILVLAILAIVAAAVIPSLRVFGAGRSNNDMATLVIGLANYARTQAIAEGRTYRLNLDARTLWLTADLDGTFQPPDSDFGKRFEAANGVQLWSDVAPHDPDGQFIEFHASGRTDPARIKLTDKMGGTIEVACVSATELFSIVPLSEASQ